MATETTALTTLVKDGARISTVEHLLSAMAGLGQLALEKREYGDAVMYFRAALKAARPANQYPMSPQHREQPGIIPSLAMLRRKSRYF